MSIIKLDKNILVTGGAGFIGSAFLRYLLQETSFKGKVINVDALTYAANLASVQSIEKDPRYIFKKGDICSQKEIENICKEYAIDLIVNFAAQTHVDRSIVDPYSFVYTNIVGVFHLLEVVRKNPSIHFHHISTDEVFGSIEDVSKSFDIDSPYRPNSPYSASKASADHLIRSYINTYGISATISQTCNNYGPFQHAEKFIPLMIQNCILNKTFPVYGKGRNIRQWIYVQDHAKALFALFEKGKRGKTYLISTNEEIENIQLLHLIIEFFCEITSQEKNRFLEKIRFVRDRAGHDFRYALSGEDFFKQMKCKPILSIREGLKKTIYWYIQNQRFNECKV